jgi:uncharacterized protein (DUF2141 family)
MHFHTRWKLGRNLGALALIVLPLTLFAAPAKNRATLVVKIIGADQKTGTIKVALYDREIHFQQVMLSGTRLTASAPAREATFRDLPPGRYAVSVYHDVDDDGQLDTYPTGYPSEPFGFSKNPKVVFGPPKWDECWFEIKRNARVVTIRITMQD